MQLTKTMPRIIWPILAILFSGCGSQPEKYISDSLPELSNDMSRIVLTREKQFAGAGSSVVFLDIGKNILSNAMIYIAGIDVEKILDVEDFASNAGVGSGDILLWFNSELFTPLKCGNSNENCLKYHRRWPKDNKTGFLYGGGLIISKEVLSQDEGIKSIIEKIRNNALSTVKVSETDAFNLELLESPRGYLADAPPYLANENINPELFVVPEVNGYVALALYGGVELTDKRSNDEWKREVVYRYRPIDNKRLSRNVQVLGSAEVGDILVWDRKPGIMRLGSAWHDGLGFMPKNMTVEAGKTYFINYTTRVGQRWELRKVD